MTQNVRSKVFVCGVDERLGFLGNCDAVGSTCVDDGIAYKVVAMSVGVSGSHVTFEYVFNDVLVEIGVCESTVAFCVSKREARSQGVEPYGDGGSVLYRHEVVSCFVEHPLRVNLGLRGRRCVVDVERHAGHHGIVSE